MSRQDEESIRAEAKEALAAAWRTFKPFLSKAESEDKRLFLRIGHLYENVSSASIKELNEVLVQARNKLGSYGIQIVGQQIIDLLDKAIESTGTIVFVQDALGEKRQEATP